jgi:hypothetical protein
MKGSAIRNEVFLYPQGEVFKKPFVINSVTAASI